MSLPQVVSREQWLEARKELLAKEKEYTRAHDALNADRRRLPMVRVETRYVFEGPDGQATLLDMFDGMRQLVVQHVMYDPEWDAACSGCTAGVDEIAPGMLAHLRTRDTAMVLVSRAPFPKLRAYAESRGWTVPWYSSHGTRFNYDFGATLDSAVMPVMWNYRNAAELEQAGMGWINERSSEQPGASCFLRDGDEIFHTYSTYARGTEQMGGSYGLLDMTALGRQEEWEEPKGRVEKPFGADPSFTSSPEA